MQFFEWLQVQVCQVYILLEGIFTVVPLHAIFLFNEMANKIYFFYCAQASIRIRINFEWSQKNND